MKTISKLVVFFIALISVLGFVGCDLALVNSNTQDIVTKEKITTKAPTITTTEAPELFTVIWKDANGTVLETDTDVADGTLPIYDGETPTRAGGIFTGWTPEVSEVTGNITYTAEYAMSYIINDELILEDENCVFTITQIEDGLLGTKIYLSFENKTTDKDLMFTWDNVSVNGYMVSAYFAEEVTAGNKANDTVTIYDLEEINISSIDYLEFNLRVYDSNNWSADDLVDSVFKVYPTGISPLEIAIPERKTTEDEIVFFDNEVGAFVILAYEVSASGEIKLEYYIENRHDVNLMFTWRDVSVNSYLIDPYFATVVAKDKREYGEITFSEWRMEELDFESIEEIEFSFVVYDEDDWSADNVIEQIYAIYPTGMTKETVVYPDRLSTTTEDIIFENDQFSFIILSSGFTEFGDFEINYYIENKTSDMDLMFSWHDVSVNNYMFDIYFAKSLISGRRAYGSITFYDYKLDQNSITSIDEIEFELKVYDYNDWLSDPLLKTVFTYNPEE